MVVLEEVPPRGRVSLYDEAGEEGGVVVRPGHQTDRHQRGVVVVRVGELCLLLTSHEVCRGPQVSQSPEDCRPGHVK